MLDTSGFCTGTHGVLLLFVRHSSLTAFQRHCSMAQRTSPKFYYIMQSFLTFFGPIRALGLGLQPIARAQRAHERPCARGAPVSHQAYARSVCVSVGAFERADRQTKKTQNTKLYAPTRMSASAHVGSARNCRPVLVRSRRRRPRRAAARVCMRV